MESLQTTSTLDHLLAQGRARRRQRADPERGRLLRLRAGLTQEDFAALLGVDRSAVAKWERGTRAPRGTVLSAYHALLARLEGEARA
jgi:DNA-binding transcriptional regulator YiaG